MSSLESRVVGIEATQKSYKGRLDGLEKAVEKLSATHADYVKENDKRVNALMTVVEVQSQQIGVLIWIMKVMGSFVLLTVLGAVLRLVFI